MLGMDQHRAFIENLAESIATATAENKYTAAQAHFLNDHIEQQEEDKSDTVKLFARLAVATQYPALQATAREFIKQLKHTEQIKRQAFTKMAMI